MMRTCGLTMAGPNCQSNTDGLDLLEFRHKRTALAIVEENFWAEEPGWTGFLGVGRVPLGDRVDPPSR
jgi:hypothetical protein